MFTDHGRAVTHDLYKRKETEEGGEETVQRQSYYILTVTVYSTRSRIFFDKKNKSISHPFRIAKASRWTVFALVLVRARHQVKVLSCWTGLTRTGIGGTTSGGVISWGAADTRFNAGANCVQAFRDGAVATTLGLLFVYFLWILFGALTSNAADLGAVLTW